MKTCSWRYCGYYSANGYVINNVNILVTGTIFLNIFFKDNHFHNAELQHFGK